MPELFNHKFQIKNHTTETIYQYIFNILNRWHAENIEFPDKTVDYGELNKLLSELCNYNYTIWHAEDYCRTKDNGLICTYKPIIDTNNQLRNNMIEKLDEYLIKYQLGTGKINSETAGSIIDRLSITILKLLHITDLNNDGKYNDRINTLQAQIIFLITAFDNLFDGMVKGTAQIVLFKQLKMYNDPATNTKIPK